MFGGHLSRSIMKPPRRVGENGREPPLAGRGKQIVGYGHSLIIANLRNLDKGKFGLQIYADWH